jgi:hypothetical protein
MYPHERSLVQKYPADKFTIVGVNTDPIEKLKEIIGNKTILWPCFSDGQTGGPISTAWRLRGYPTIYILDEKGRIYLKQVGNNEQVIDQALEKLMSKHR